MIHLTAQEANGRNFAGGETACKHPIPMRALQLAAQCAQGQYRRLSDFERLRCNTGMNIIAPPPVQARGTEATISVSAFLPAAWEIL